MNEKHILTLEITNCEDCLLKKSHKGHGECFEYCSHPDSPDGYQSIIHGCQEKFTETPSWCPIFKKRQIKI